MAWHGSLIFRPLCVVLLLISVTATGASPGQSQLNPCAEGGETFDQNVWLGNHRHCVGDLGAGDGYDWYSFGNQNDLGAFSGIDIYVCPLTSAPFAMSIDLYYRPLGDYSDNVWDLVTPGMDMGQVPDCSYVAADAPVGHEGQWLVEIARWAGSGEYEMRVDVTVG